MSGSHLCRVLFVLLKFLTSLQCQERKPLLSCPFYWTLSIVVADGRTINQAHFNYLLTNSYQVCIVCSWGDEMRINITISEELCKQVDERAKAMFISRSAYISTALSQKMQADDAMRMLPETAKTMQDAMEMMKQGKDPSTAIKAVEGRVEG